MSGHILQSVLPSSPTYRDFVVHSVWLTSHKEMSKHLLQVHQE